MKFPTIHIEGAILAADILDKIEAGDIQGQKPADFGIKGTVKDEIARAWADAQDYWRIYQRKIATLGEKNLGTTETRNLWVAPLLGLLSYKPEFQQRGEVVNEKTFAISHRDTSRGGFPVHVMGFRDSLDRKRQDSGPRMSPHALLQEYLNLTEHLYAIVTNGLQLRLLRDSTRLVKLSYLEFDLDQMFDEGHFADFAVMYRLLHATRMPVSPDNAAESLIEEYHQESLDSGSRIRDGLSLAVEKCIKAFANGFLNHPDNTELREAIKSGNLDATAFYQSQLRLIYRLLFLMVIEERDLVYPQQVDRKHRDIYYRYYSVSNLRRLAGKRYLADARHKDYWMALKNTFRLFEDERYGTPLGIRPLAGGLFGPGAIRHLNKCSLDNAVLIGCLTDLSIFEHPETQQRIRINYAALNVEEFGSVYEGLLEYDPVISQTNGHAIFAFQKGEGRSASGSHYTPDELVQPLIKHSLDYVIAEKLKEKDKEKALLSIRVCDVACGSGHILLNAARRIATELAIVRTGEDQPSPAAFRQAIRDVIRHCIYGVDLNPLAVELCKVALWLEAHNPGEPLNFLDHHIKCGNSIVGLAHESELERGIADEAFKRLPDDDKDVAALFRDRNKQERKEAKQKQLDLTAKIKAELGDALKKLSELDAMPETTPQDIEKKHHRYEELSSDKNLWHLRTLANIQAAQFFIPKTPDNKHLLITDAEYREYLQGERHPQSQAVARAGAVAVHKRFFHWFLEFPDVFEQGGFDCILGNPPYLGAKKLSGTYGDSFLNWLKFSYLPAGGLSDLVVYFLRRISTIIRERGFLAVITSNAISKGDSRDGGLKHLSDNGFAINFAVRTVKWPGQASLEVSLLALFRGVWSNARSLNGREVQKIDSSLGEAEEQRNPERLHANHGVCFIGSVISGTGFLLSREEYESLIASDPKSKHVIFPYLSGDDLNSDCEQRPARWAINFYDWPLERAEEYAKCLEIVEAKVKPQRDKVKRAVYRERWWQFAERCATLYDNLKGKSKALVISNHTKTASFAFIDTGIVFSHGTSVVASESFSHFALLNSSFHEAWAWRYGSSLESRLRYTPSDCFETFPFPSSLNSSVESGLELIGESYHEHRRQLMLKMQLGLTNTYNLFHDHALSVELVAKESKQPQAVAESAYVDLLELRSLHVQMDQAVLAAYGWNAPSAVGPAIDLLHNFYEVDYLPENDRTRYTIHPEARREILGRLLKLNHARAAEEAAAAKESAQSVRKRSAKQPALQFPATDTPLFRVMPPAATTRVQPSLRELVAAFDFVIPKRQRPRINTTAELYTTLVPALVQEAGGSLKYADLEKAMSFLADPPSNATSLPENATKVFAAWRAGYPSSLTDPKAFPAALHDLIVMRHMLNIFGADNEFVILKGVQWVDITFDWSLLDARMALSHAAGAQIASPTWRSAVPERDLRQWAVA